MSCKGSGKHTVCSACKGKRGDVNGECQSCSGTGIDLYGYIMMGF